MFDGKRKLSLVLGAGAGVLSRNNASIRVNELFEEFNVFVVNMLDVIDEAVIIRKWLDRRPKLGNIFLSGKQPSKQLKHYYNKKKIKI